METIKQTIERRTLPSSQDELLAPLMQDEGHFVPQEGLYWDFKREWPFSYSDEYFAGIARLICAFANTYGGIIIFGVHDEERTPGHNKVAPNLDRLEQALKQLLTAVPELLCKRYEAGKPGAVDVLLVNPLSAASAPIKFARPLKPYSKPGTIWVRQNHEVVPAEPRHIGILYCRSSADLSVQEDVTISGGLPPSAATVKRFIGRINTIDRLFGWIKSSDEPRMFLYGKGGSGKTTIAYEIAKVLKLEGSRIEIHGHEKLDNVIFVSAKQQMLNVMTQSADAFVGLDFSNEKELYEAILTLANWTSEPLAGLSLDALRAEIKALFDLTSNFIVVDDIDTLTTKGIEAGFDFLYGVLWRSKRRSKILYTIRAVPAQSLANSVEVPGLEDGDYEEFVRVCSEQFNVPSPEPHFVSNNLSAISERRPLVIESIIALRRTAGTYSKAIELFEEGTGEDVRSYVFQREWNSLPANNLGRVILAILALYGDPLTFADLVALTRHDDSKVRDALADVREMFLKLNEVGNETTFQLGALTRAFVLEQSKRLTGYSSLKERVEKYRTNFYPENPILSRLRSRAESLIQKGERSSNREALRQALSIILDPSLSPRISEDPRFVSLKAYCYVCQIPSQLDDARREFKHVIAMKFESDVEYLRRWWLAELASGYGIEQCIMIADIVSQGKKYSDEEKIEFLSKKAASLYNLGRENSVIGHIYRALVLNLQCYTKYCDLGSVKTDRSEEHARSTAYYLFDLLLRSDGHDEFFRICSELCKDQNIKFDPLEAPLLRSLELLKRERRPRPMLTKLRGKLENFRGEIDKKSTWYDRFARERISGSAASAVQSLAERMRSM
jgi:hypothetical protein